MNKLVVLLYHLFMPWDKNSKWSKGPICKCKFNFDFGVAPPISYWTWNNVNNGYGLLIIMVLKLQKRSFFFQLNIAKVTFCIPKINKQWNVIQECLMSNFHFASWMWFLMLRGYLTRFNGEPCVKDLDENQQFVWQAQ